MKEITVLDTKININNINGNDYICLTDMIKAKDGNFFITEIG